MTNIDWDVMEDLDEQVGDQGFTKRTGEGNASISNCECVHETEKALIVHIGGTNIKRPIPKSHVRPSSEVQKKGDRGTLVITKWLGRKIDQEDPMQYEMAEAEYVEFPNCVCLSEARTGKSIVVKFPDGKEVMLPTSQVDDNSPVRYDGDRGTLRIKPWIAKEKGLVPT